jgi:hypothetical protein
MKLKTGEMYKNKEKVVGLLRETKRQGIENLITWMEDESDFFTAPASTRLDYHGCYEGGLAEHSLNVYQLFSEKVDRFKIDIRDDEITICTILHDLCKANLYVPNVTDKGYRSESKPYKVEDNFPIGHGEKSVYMAMKNILLTEREAVLIRWHMGAFDSSWEDNVDRLGKVQPAIYALHNADLEASVYLDDK